MLCGMLALSQTPLPLHAQSNPSDENAISMDTSFEEDDSSDSLSMETAEDDTSRTPSKAQGNRKDSGSAYSVPLEGKGANRRKPNYYPNYGSCQEEYLYPTDTGSLRVEKLDGQKLGIFTYDSSNQLIEQRTLSLKLPIFGAFYAGEQYYYVVTGQTNPEENDTKEVINVTAYSKDWKEAASTSLSGINTIVPFANGSASLCEADGRLYLHTSHQMYTSDDGLNHQANMTFILDASTLSVIDSSTKVSNISYGYVSHSFMQYIQTDGQNIYRADHGDAYPRALVVTSMSKNADLGSRIKYQEVFQIDGNIGANFTGVYPGGFELSSNNCLLAGKAKGKAGNERNAQANVFISITSKNLDAPKTVWITDYANDAQIEIGTVRLTKKNDNTFLLLWEETHGDGNIVKAVGIDEKGNQITDTATLFMDLGSCNPVLFPDGTIRWTTTNTAGDCSMHIVDPDRPEDMNISLDDVIVDDFSPVYTYSGEPITQNVTLRYDTSTLVEGTHYQISYSNNTDAGTATMTITGIGSCTGTITKELTINPIEVEWWQLTLENYPESYPYTGSPITPDPTVVYNNVTLVKNKDYRLSFENNTQPGYGKMTITLTGNYSGASDYRFAITCFDLSFSEIENLSPTYSYTGTPICPKPDVALFDRWLWEEDDYTLSYSNNVNCGTATITITGKGEYSGSISKQFEIVPAQLNYWDTTLPAYSFDYTGSPITPEPTVVHEGVTLIKGKDYTLSYTNNVNPGTATVTVTGIGNYTGSVEETFWINEGVSAPDNIYDATINNVSSSYVYTGSSITPKPVVTYSGRVLRENVDYTLAYADNLNCGRATLTIYGIGNFTGSISLSFTITPAALLSSNVNGISSSYTFTGKPITPEPKVTHGGRTLVKGRDYKIAYANNTQPGKATMTIIGIGNYTGQKTITFQIVETATKTEKTVMHRLYNPNSGEHFYTASTNEKDYLAKIGWKYEGTGWIAPKESSTPVFRLYNHNDGDHHYTMDAREKDALVRLGWKYEGIGWYSDDAKGVPLYRQYNPNAKAGSHNYTTNKAENDYLVKIGWKGEGIGWYGVK